MTFSKKWKTTFNVKINKSISTVDKLSCTVQSTRKNEHLRNRIAVDVILKCTFLATLHACAHILRNAELSALPEGIPVWFYDNKGLVMRFSNIYQHNT